MRPVRILVIVMVAFLQLACGEHRATSPTAGPTPVPEPLPAPTPATVVLSGHVRDGETNQPAVGALVVLRWPDGRFRNNQSDGAGYFSFANVPLGVATIYSATNYAHAEREVTLTGDTVIDMVLAPRKYVLYGRVTDMVSGLPLAGATLTVIEPPWAREPNAGRATTSGSDGAYRLADIWTGDIRLQVRRTGHDPVFGVVKVIRDTQHDIHMRVAQQTVAGTWTGELTATGFAGGTPVWIGVVPVTQTGATIAADFQGIAFTGTLADPSRIGATTQIAGTLSITRAPGGPRIPPPQPCVGTGRFTGTVNWTRLVITAPQVTFSCGSTEKVTLSLVR